MDIVRRLEKSLMAIRGEQAPENEEDERIYCLVANVTQEKVLRNGAKVYVIQLSYDGAYVTGLSKGGRRVTKWVALKRVSNFRAAWIPKHMKHILVGYPKHEIEKAAYLYNKEFGKKSNGPTGDQEDT